MTVNGKKPLRVDLSGTTGRYHGSASHWSAGNVQSRLVRGAGQIRKKVGEIYHYEAKQSYAVVAKVVDGNGGLNSINAILEGRFALLWGLMEHGRMNSETRKTP